MYDLQKEICRYDALIDNILKDSPFGEICGDKLTKFHELFNKEDSYAVFLVMAWKLSMMKTRLKNLEDCAHLTWKGAARKNEEDMQKLADEMEREIEKCLFY